jgi:hypothetical protein
LADFGALGGIFVLAGRVFGCEFVWDDLALVFDGLFGLVCVFDGGFVLFGNGFVLDRDLVVGCDWFVFTGR